MNGKGNVNIYMEYYYSAIKMRESLPFLTTAMHLEDTMVNEVSQTQKDTYYMISLICWI